MLRLQPFGEEKKRTDRADRGGDKQLKSRLNESSPFYFFLTLLQQKSEFIQIRHRLVVA
jgi:hypothetical protein